MTQERNRQVSEEMERNDPAEDVAGAFSASAV